MKFNVKYFDILFCVCIVFLSLKSFVYTYSESLLLYNEKVCQSIDIRKRSHLNQLNNCTVIEGDLYIVMVTLLPDRSFPNLKEITGSLVIYYVKGIKSLETYFPNLVIIRGQTLAYNYAVVIKETNLLYIGLVNLRLILFGGVRIDNNPSLCYVSSIDWLSIVKQSGVPIKIINMRNICPDFCPRNCSQNLGFIKHSREYCWSHKTCHTSCSQHCSSKNLYCFMNDTNQCCHPECLGGCYGNGNDKCVSCKHVMFHGRCVQKCEKFFYKYKNRRCITEEQCSKLSFHFSTDDRRKDLYAIEDDSCVKQCSPDKERDKITGHCVACRSNCSKKYCGKILIHSINDLKEVDGCYSIEEIYISIKEGGASLSEILSKSFSKLKVIENSLKIIRSSSITSLSFLKSLRLIKGNLVKKGHQKNQTLEIKNESIVFEVYDNENLVEISNDKLLGEELNITILHGSTSFNLNRKLCPAKILTFLKFNVHSHTKLTNLEEKIINSTNGDISFCKHEKINVIIKAVTDSSFTVECKSTIGDVLLRDSGSAALFMLKETQKNVSLYELFNTCNKQDWRTIEGSLGKPVEVKGLQPAKRYAFYVEAIRSRTDNWLEISDIIYFKTKWKSPSPPMNFKTDTLSHSEIKLSWDPPTHPNGIVTKYVIWYRSFEIFHEDFLVDEFCPYKSYSQKHRLRSEPVKESALNNHANSMHMTCDCNSCATLCNDNQLKQSVDPINVDFQLLDDYISQSIKKQNNIPTSNWLPDPSQNLEIKNITVNESYQHDQTSTYVTPKHPDFRNWSLFPNSSKSHVKMIELSADINFFIVSNLHYYTEYLFEIQACQNPNVDEMYSKYQKDVDNENAIHILKSTCSLRSSVSAHTLPKENMDNMNESLIHSVVMGNNVKIHWTEPDTPNGLVLNFFIRYRELNDKNNENWLEKICINRVDWLKNKDFDTNETHSLNLTSSVLNKQKQSGSFVLENLRSGNYEFQIKSISIPGDGSWTKSLYFEIDHNSIFEIHRSIFIVGSIITIVLLISSIGLAYYYYKKKYSVKTKWVSSNPDYWIIYEIDEWEIDRKDVDMIEWNFPLGRGSFGMVYKGILKNLTSPAKNYFNKSDLKDNYVAVKTLNANSTILERREFINEACYMKQFQSYHLVKLLGVVSKISNMTKNKRRFSLRLFYNKFSFIEKLLHPRTWKLTRKISIFKSSNSTIQDISNKELEVMSLAPQNSFKTVISQHFQKMPLVIMELMEYGDLAGYLRKQGEEGEGVISETQSHLWAMQIADGMLYLSDMKFVHRDLAARNCMINSMLIIKIGDFGMARDIYYDCYYRKEGKGRLPVRWMAPESLQSAYFTTSSDIWSYGVVLWEISTLASLPYLGMSNHDVIKFVTNEGTLLSNGVFSCSKLILNIVENCWQYNPEDRPTFLEISQKLEPYSDQNFQTNSYYFTQNQWSNQNEEKDLSVTTQLDKEYSVQNFFQSQ